MEDVEVSRMFLVLLMEEILHHTGMFMFKTKANNGINYQPQLVTAGFLNHQQYPATDCCLQQKSTIYKTGLSIHLGSDHIDVGPSTRQSNMAPRHQSSYSQMMIGVYNHRNETHGI